MEDSVLSSDWPLRPVECAICKEVLRDPRILPCGHLFCGSRHSNEEIEGCSFDLEPGNRISCLRKLVVNNEEIDEEERSSGSITHVKCALCNRNYHIDLERLAPMYGIREFLDSVRRGHVNITENKALIKNQTNKDKYLKKGMEVICVYHAPLPVEFQCMNCEGEQMLCKFCFEEDHFGHPVRLKASLDQEVFVQTMDTLDIAETRMRCKEGACRAETQIAKLEASLTHMRMLHERLMGLDQATERLLGDRERSELDLGKKRRLFDYSDITCCELVSVANEWKNVQNGIYKSLLRTDRGVRKSEIVRKSKKRSCFDDIRNLLLGFSNIDVAVLFVLILCNVAMLVTSS